MVQCDPSLDLVSQGFIRFLYTMLQFCQSRWSFASTFKSPNKHSGEFLPTVYAARCQLSQPCSGRAFQHQRKVLHGHFMIATTDLYSHSVILKPSVRLRFTSELTNSSRQPEVGRDLCGSDGPAKTFGTRNMHSASSRVISVLPFSVCPVPVNQTLNENRSRIKARLSRVDWNSSPTTVEASVIVLPRHI